MKQLQRRYYVVHGLGGQRIEAAGIFEQENRKQLDCLHTQMQKKMKEVNYSTVSLL